MVTKIGFDHINILGNRPHQVVHQKAMIFLKGTELATILQFLSVQKEIQEVVKVHEGHLYMINLSLGLIPRRLRRNCIVIPAEAGIQSQMNLFYIENHSLDSRLRGDDTSGYPDACVGEDVI